MKLNKLEAAFEAAISQAIRVVGFGVFKSSSIFGSNDRAAKEDSKAA